MPPLDLDWQIERLPADQRKTVRLWLAEAEQNRRSEAGYVLPNPADVRLLGSITADGRLPICHKNTRARCVHFEWLGRKSVKWFVTQRGRAAMALVEARRA